MKSQMEHANTKQTIEFKDYFSLKENLLFTTWEIYKTKVTTKEYNILTKKNKNKKFPFPKFDTSQSLTFNGNCHPTFNVDSLQDAKDGCVRSMMANVANNVKWPCNIVKTPIATNLKHYTWA